MAGAQALGEFVSLDAGESFAIEYWPLELYKLAQAPPPDELEEHYRQRNTLKVNILPEDIAQAVLHFASDARSGKSTGNVLNVDGGVPAAYSR